jgi:murein DD-endopeptidase MepM/ murein hydrolase activator NlpD
MARRSGTLQGIPSDSVHDYMMPSLSSKDLSRDKLVSYTSTKIYNNRPKTFDITKILEGYTLTALESITDDNASMISAWRADTSPSGNTIKLKAARVRIPLIHDGFLPDPLNEEDVKKFGNQEAVINLHPLAYMEVSGEGGGIMGFFGVSNEPVAFTRAKIQIKDANLTRFEILSFLNKLTTNTASGGTAGGRSSGGGGSRRATDLTNCDGKEAKVVRGKTLSELYHIVEDFYEPIFVSLPIADPELRAGSPACKRIDPVAAQKGEIKYQSGGHKGIDIPAEIGIPVLAAADGYVIISKQSDSAGNYVSIVHEPENYKQLPSTVKSKMKLLYTRYLHLSSRNVQQGARVTAGQVIGYSGNTGERTTGPHLHYETRIFYDLRLREHNRRYDEFETQGIVLSPFLDPERNPSSVAGKFSEGYAKPYRQSIMTPNSQPSKQSKDSKEDDFIEFLNS